MHRQDDRQPIEPSHAACEGRRVRAALVATGCARNEPRGFAADGLKQLCVDGLGAFAVTFAVNVPLNEALAAAVPTSDNAADVWHQYAAHWTVWNHVRALASVAAFGLLAAALVVDHQR
jgi:Anthrone oxygenase